MSLASRPNESPILTGRAAHRLSVNVSTALAAVLACAVLLPLLGHRSLAMWDEGIYAEIAREMLHRGLLLPLWNYHPWFEKPPLMLWIIACFFHLFGINEFWARAGSAFSGVALVALLHRWVARRRGRSVAWLGSLILLSTFGFLHVCRVGEMDTLLSLSEIAAVLGLVRIHERDLRGWYVFWIGFAIALMTKDAASIVLPFTLIVVAVTERWRWQHFGKSFLAGLALFLLLVLPWHVAMLLRFGDIFLHQYVGFHVLARASSQIEGHHTHAWYYLLVLLVSAPPWVLLYPSSIAETFRRTELHSARILAIFTLVVLVFFTLVQTRLPHYIAPAYPALSVLTAVFLHRRWQEFAPRWRSPRARTDLALAAILVWGITSLATEHPRKQLHSPRLSNGMITPDTHEPAALLKQTLRQPQPENDPLLLWSQTPIAPVTTALFYSRRPVQQVALAPLPSSLAIDKYTWNPIPLEAAVTSEPRLALVEKPLLSQLPPDLQFTPLQSSQHWTIGSLVRRSQ
jgi:4-amino-4-deoxy-L-arabinose transferase-like glycosyltransferase